MIQPPQVPLFSDTGATELPFDLKGAPLSNPPTSVKGLQEKIRKSSKKPEFTEDIQYFTNEKYFSVQLNTKNILDDAQDFVNQTSLKYPNTTEGSLYSLKFICLHRNLFGSEGLQLSLLFQTKEVRTKFFHLCIPVTGTPIDAKQTENPFLKAWLKSTGATSVPPGFTMNEVLNFGLPDQTPIQFTTIQYCLSLLTYFGPMQNTYTLCLYKTPLLLKRTGIPEWLASDFTMMQPAPVLNDSFSDMYMRKTYSEIFNLMYRNFVRKNLGSWVGKFGVINMVKSGDPVIEPPEFRQVSTTDYFSSKQLISEFPKPIYYKVKMKSNSKRGDAIEGFTSPRLLDNVKCYPIDLVTDVNTDGSVLVDENTKKPIHILDAKGTMSAYATIDPETQSLEQQDFLESMAGITILVLGVLFFGIIIIVIVIRVFRGTSFASVATSAATNAVSAVAK